MSAIAISTRRGATRLVLLAIAYFCLAAVSVRFTRFEGGVAFVWAAGAILFAELSVTPRRIWPARMAVCFVASIITTGTVGLGLAAAIPLAVVNIGEAAVGAWLMRRFSPGFGRFRSLKEIVAFLVIAGVAVPALSGAFGATIAHVASGTPLGSNWLSWFTGHALGTVTFAPLCLLALRGEPARWREVATPRAWAEAVALLAFVVMVSVGVFAQTRLPLLFLPFLPIMIAVFRLGRFGAAASVVLLTAIGVAFTLHGQGPVSLIAAAPGAKAQFLQFYIATAVLMTLPAAAELKRRKRLLIALRETSALHQLILDRTSDIVLKLEVDGTIRYASPAIQRIGGYAPHQLVGRKPHDLIESDDVAEVIRAHRQALAHPNDTFIVQYRARRDDGGVGWFETHTRATVDADGKPTGAVSIIREITQRKALETELEHAATTDPLTGLANRRAFDTVLARRLSLGDGPETRTALAIFDLDHFKRVNDRFGHATGDRVLCAFAAILKTSVREHDLVARLGGEEFAAILSGASLEQAQAVCERIRVRMLDTIVASDGQNARATVSAGLTALTPGATAEAILATADAALYRAKLAGRNRLALAA